MKKILMGLLAVSAISFAAAPSLTEANSNLFNPGAGEKGTITVTGTLTSDVPVVKYVVFANTSDNYATSSDSLTLPKFIIGFTSGNTGFQETVPNIYVRKVNNDKNGTEIASGVNPIFTINLDERYTSYTDRKVQFGSEQAELAVYPTSLLSESQFQGMLGRDDGLDANWGWGVFTYGGYDIHAATKLSFVAEVDGVLKIKNKSHTASTLETANKLISQRFAEGVSITFPITVEIK